MMSLDQIEATKRGWLRDLGAKPQAKIRLFCLPYAGAGVSVFHNWRTLAPDWLELVGVQLPGREDLAAEPLINDPEQIVTEITSQIGYHDDLPFALYGHSMGAGLAFRIAQKCQPCHLFVGAHRAPSSPYRYETVLDRDYDGLLEIIKYFGGLSQKAMSNQSFLDYYVPIISNDLYVCERNTFNPRTQISCPITVMIGAHDTTLTAAEYLDWGQQSRAGADYVTIDGDHFFIRSHAQDVVAHISEKLHEIEALK